MAHEDFPRVFVSIRPSTSELGRSSESLVLVFTPLMSDRIICHLAKKCEKRDPRKSWEPMADPLLSIDLDILISPNKRVEASVAVMLPETGEGSALKLYKNYISLHTFAPDSRNSDLVERSLILLNYLQSHVVKNDEIRRSINTGLSFVLYVKYNLCVEKL